MENISRRKIVQSFALSPALLLPKYESFIANTELIGHFATLLSSREISPEYYNEQIYKLNADFSVFDLSRGVAQIKIENSLTDGTPIGMIAKTVTAAGNQISGEGSVYMDQFGTDDWVDISTAFIPAHVGSTLDGAVIQCSFGYLDYTDGSKFTKVIGEGYFRGEETLQRLSFYVPDESQMRCLSQTDSRYLGQALKEEVVVWDQFDMEKWQTNLTRKIADTSRPFYNLMNITS